MRIFCYLSEAVQDRAGGVIGLTHRHRFCTTVQVEMALRVTESLDTEFAARGQIMLLDEPIMEVLLRLNCSLLQQSRLTPIVGEVLEWQCPYHASLASHRMTEIDNLNGEPIMFFSSEHALSAPFIFCHQSSETLSAFSTISNTDGDS